MSMDAHTLHSLIESVIKKVPKFYSKDAVTLLMMTAAIESDLGTYMRQIGGGPGRGVMQVEPETMRDNYGNFLYFRDRLKNDIFKACGVCGYDIYALEYNMDFNILMARLKYWRAPGAIPSDLEGMAKYHEKFYNAHKGNYASTGMEDWEVTLAKYHRYVT